MEEREEERDDDGNGERERECTTKCILEESTTIGFNGHDDFPSNECNINPEPQFHTPQTEFW